MSLPCVLYISLQKGVRTAKACIYSSMDRDLPFEHTMYAKRSLSAPVPRSLTQSTQNLPPHISLSQPLFRGLHQGCVYSLHTSSAPHLSFLPPLPLRLTFCSSDVCMSGCRAAVTPLYMCSLVTCESASTKCCKEMNRNYTILHSLLQSSHCRCHCWNCPQERTLVCMALCEI